MLRTHDELDTGKRNIHTLAKRKASSWSNLSCSTAACLQVKSQLIVRYEMSGDPL